MKKFLFTIFLLFFAFSISAQNNDETYWLHFNFGYGRTFLDMGQHTDWLIDADKTKFMADFGCKLGYYITPQLALGAGIGITPYRNYDMMTVPLRAFVQYDFTNVPRLFAYFDAGIPLSVETASTHFINAIFSNYSVDYQNGCIAEAGIGYRVLFHRYRSLYVSLSYNMFYHKLSVNPYDNELEPLSAWRSRHSILFKAGYNFNIYKIFQH